MIQKIAARLEEQIKENLFELELLDQKRAENVKSSKEYEEYIKSSEWQETRQRILKRDAFRCVLCGTTKNLHVHHITYENLGEEKDADLVTLCDYCHKRLHESDIPNFPFRCLIRAIEVAELMSVSENEDYKAIGRAVLPTLNEAKANFNAKINNLKEKWEKERNK